MNQPVKDLAHVQHLCDYCPLFFCHCYVIAVPLLFYSNPLLTSRLSLHCIVARSSVAQPCTLST